MREPRCILITGDTVGGVWTFTLELAEALGEHGIEVVLAAMGGLPTAAQREEAASIPNLVLIASGFKLEWMDDPWADIEAAGRWLLGLEKRYRPDIIHLNSYGHGGLPWSTPVILTAHSCVLSWWAAVKGGTPPAEWDRYRAEVSCSIATAAVVTAPTRAMLRTLETFYRRPECGMTIPNGRTAHRFPAGQKEPIILTAGRLWDEGKNAGAVAAAAAHLPWPVYLAGESAPFDGCHMLGRLSAVDMARWFARASIYALPARYEPFGLSALEAGLAGCALVLGDIPSLREVWQDAAIFVPPGDPHRLEAALRALIGNPPQRERMAQRAAARAREFTPDRMARGYLDAYRVAAESRRAACVS